MLFKQLPYVTVNQPRTKHHALCTVAGTVQLSAMLCCIQVLVVFKAAPELCNLLRAVEEEYTKAREQHKSRVEGPHADVLPWIQAQAAAFESAASASVRDAPTAHAVCLVQQLFLTEPSSICHHSIATPGLTNALVCHSWRRKASM